MNVDVTVLPQTSIDVYAVGGANITINTSGNPNIIGIQDKIVQGVTQQWVSGNFAPLSKVYVGESPTMLNPTTATGFYHIWGSFWRHYYHESNWSGYGWSKNDVQDKSE